MAGGVPWRSSTPPARSWRCCRGSPPRTSRRSSGRSSAASPPLGWPRPSGPGASGETAGAGTSPERRSRDRRRQRPEGAHVVGLGVLIRQPVGGGARVAGAQLRLVDGGDPQLAAQRALGAGEGVAVVPDAVV